LILLPMKNIKEFIVNSDKIIYMENVGNPYLHYYIFDTKQRESHPRSSFSSIYNFGDNPKYVLASYNRMGKLVLFDIEYGNDIYLLTGVESPIGSIIPINKT